MGVNSINALLERYDLDTRVVYLLPIIPLIETMWADGICQEQEKEILFDYTRKHLEKLAEFANGIEVISMNEAFDFLKRFLYERPSAELLKDLRECALHSLNKQNDDAAKKELINYCMDIAAACVPHYPYDSNERIIEEEKQLIQELISRLNV
jgi:hypothetical protein